MFLGADGKPLPFDEAVLSGRATGVPGAVQDAGRWRTGSTAGCRGAACSATRERTADEGFIVSPRLARLVRGELPAEQRAGRRRLFHQARRHAGRGRRPAAQPGLCRFPAAAGGPGPAALYAGATAARIVARTRAAPLGGSMTMADLANYRPVKREALCRPYRVYRVCVPPPPSSGVGLLQLLMLLERTDIAARGPADPQAWFLFAEASRHDVRRPRPLCRRSGLRDRAGRGAARPRLCRRRARG